MNLYQEELLDHYRFPRNLGIIENPDFSHNVNNFSCGDSISISGKINNNILEEVKFQGSGCVISQATASMLSEKVINKDIFFINNLDKNYILNLINIPVGPTRLRCALLALEALHEGIKQKAL